MVGFGRLQRALAARSYQEAWQRHHEPKGKNAHKQKLGKLAAMDREKVFELVRLAAEEKRVEQRS